MPRKKRASGPPDGSKQGYLGAEALRELKNEAFEAYYQWQLAPILEGQWEAFDACLRLPLPVTWRISGCGKSSQALRDHMERAILPPLTDQPWPLPWHPRRLAWQAGVSRATLRGKDTSGKDRDAGGTTGSSDARSNATRALHSWLTTEGELGRVQRQEAVSMVPALLLDVQPGLAVLDMCASPGSKTLQLLEMVDAKVAEVDAKVAEVDGGTGGLDVDGGYIDGLVVANDDDGKRCQMLASRAGALRSASLLVTNHDARLLPEWLAGDVRAATDAECPATHTLSGGDSVVTTVATSDGVSCSLIECLRMCPALAMERCARIR